MSKAKPAAMSGKPQPKIKFPIHDTHLKKSLSHVKTACILALLAPFCFYMLHNLPRKMKYKKFYSSYDPLDAFDRMQSGGYLSSCPKESKSDKKDDKKDDKKKK
ncbi:uncharacterized protein COX6CL isoform X2 [Drosophila virilis]|uniref:Uncharacterized protein n=1 Tax=Drosophila virilis TaxID=7244 RepID=B4LRV9_DROVI|nr:uncharacterized protein LOC6628587 [Drosophila virilis]EDW63635.2 uncharacterized protein Dvir_GJ12019 [Drosophila virilis]